MNYEEAFWISGGPPPFAVPTAKITREVIEVAHASNMPVPLHTTTPIGHRFALDTGISILAHELWEWPARCVLYGGYPATRPLEPHSGRSNLPYRPPTEVASRIRTFNWR